MLRVHLLAHPVLASLLLLACGGLADSAEDVGETGGAEEATSAPTDAGDETAATTGPPVVPGCDVVVRGEEDGPEALAAAIEGHREGGGTVCLSGTFHPTGPIGGADVHALTLRGIDPGDEVGAGATLDFARTAGLSFTGFTGLTLENLSVVDALADAVVAAEGSDFTARGVRVAWSGANTGEELFGIRVAEATGVTIEGCDVAGARDAGIWVQASTAVTVRGSHAHGNVAGIELENCAQGEIVDNDADGNVIGLFVLDLPMSAFGNGGGILVRGNRSRDNNIANFAADGAVSASIPTGIGALVLASDRVELRDNEFTGNDTTGALVVSFAVVELLSGMSYDDPTYDGWPETVEIHDNTFAGNGTMPADVFTSVFMQPTMPAITWDGAVDEDKPVDPALALCIRANGDADFLNLDALNLGANKSSDLTPHDCDHPDVPGAGG